MHPNQNTEDLEPTQDGQTASSSQGKLVGKGADKKSSASRALEIEKEVEGLLDATLANDHNRIDAHYGALFKFGMNRERAEKRILYLWAERYGFDISPGASGTNLGERRIGAEKMSRGLREQLPGFGLDKELHLLVADAGAGKTAAAAELATIYSARDRGFLDHEEPRTDPENDKRNTVLVIASDGDGSAFAMWEDYLGTVNAFERGASIAIWAQDDDTGERPFNVTLTNLDRLNKRVEKGDIAAVIIDTANAIFRGAGLSSGVGPVEEYLRLLKQIVCRHCALWILHHTNRSGTASIKGIGGHPAFQEVPSVIHMIETRENSNGERLRIWHVLKLRGSNYRRFSYELKDGVFQVTDGHYFQNCSDEVLVEINKQIKQRNEGTAGSTKASHLISVTSRPSQSVYNAIDKLKKEGLIKSKGTGYQLTAEGQKRVESLRVSTNVEALPPYDPSTLDW